jgi:hypothetical protein
MVYDYDEQYGQKEGDKKGLPVPALYPFVDVAHSTDQSATQLSAL